MATQWSLFLSCLHFGSIPLSLVLSKAVFEALSESTQGKEALWPGAVLVHDLEISRQLACCKHKEAIRRTGRCRDKGTPGHGGQVSGSVSFSKEAEGARYPLLYPSLPRQRLPLGRPHSRALANFESSSAAGMELSVSCPDKTGRVWASFILER